MKKSIVFLYLCLLVSTTFASVNSNHSLMCGEDSLLIKYLNDTNCFQYSSFTFQNKTITYLVLTRGFDDSLTLTIGDNIITDHFKTSTSAEHTLHGDISILKPVDSTELIVKLEFINSNKKPLSFKLEKNYNYVYIARFSNCWEILYSQCPSINKW